MIDINSNVVVYEMCCHYSKQSCCNAAKCMRHSIKIHNTGLQAEWVSVDAVIQNLVPVVVKDGYCRVLELRIRNSSVRSKKGRRGPNSMVGQALISRRSTCISRVQRQPGTKKMV